MVTSMIRDLWGFGRDVETMYSRLRLLLPLVAVSCILCGGCSFSFGPRVWVEDTTAFKVPSSSVEQVACRTHNGSIRVVGAATEVIDVMVSMRARGEDEMDAEACLDAIEVYRERNDGTLTLGWRWRGTRRPTWGARVSFSIAQPVEISSTLRTHNGRVRVDNVRGGASVISHNGRIELESCAGGIAAVTHNGRITATAEAPNVRLKTHNGRIEARLTATGSIDGSIETHNGRVLVSLGPEASVRVTCATHNGSVSATRAFHIQRKSRRVFVGEVGNGSGRLRVRTHNGSITLE